MAQTRGERPVAVYVAGGLAVGAGIGYLASRFISGGTAAQLGAGKKVAVVLAGCGVNDGSECTEATALLVHLSRHGAEVTCYAPNIAQHDVIDHYKGAPADTEGWSKRRGSIAWAAEGRNTLSESARIARGAVRPLSECKVENFDAIAFPGGFGVAKTLSTWATESAQCTVEADVERVIGEFHAAKKPLAMCCIAPVLACKLIPGVTVTLGCETEQDEAGGHWPYSGTCAAVTGMGATHEAAGPTGVVVDAVKKVVTSPAYMFDATPYEVFQSVGNMVDAALSIS